MFIIQHIFSYVCKALSSLSRGICYLKYKLIYLPFYLLLFHAHYFMYQSTTSHSHSLCTKTEYTELETVEFCIKAF
jgi:hypothetical protein